jgi:hypothetical protein
MIPRIAIVAAAVAAICSTAPVSAEEVGVRVGPGGVTVGTSRPDREVVREREVIRDRDEHRGRDETVVIRKHDRDHDDGPARKVIIDRE